MIRFACPTCQKVHKAPENAAGRKVRCLRCSQTIIIPVPAEIKNKPLVGLLLPEKTTQEPPAIPSDESIDHSFDDCISPADSLPVDPPPVRQSPAPETHVNLGSTDPFGDILPMEAEEPYWVPPNHLMQGLVATIGAAVMFFLILLFFNIRWPPGPSFARIIQAVSTTALTWCCP